MKTDKHLHRHLAVFIALLFLLSFLPGHSVRAAGIRYAKPISIGSGNCSSWDNACTLQTALTGAISGDEIWVAAGIYTPTVDTNRYATFHLKYEVDVYGGFAGTETSREERDWIANVTTLSGDIGVLGDDSDNSYHVVTGADGAILDGFTIEKGNANGLDGTDCGGGIYNNYSSPELANLVITGNKAEEGGGMYNYHSSTTLNQITFYANSAGSGGGIQNDSYSYPTLLGVTFNVNTAGHGGGISNSYSSPTITNSTFYGNSAEYGGGMWNAYLSNPVLVYTTFTGNSATYAGGAIGNMVDGPYGNFYIYDSIFWGNTAPSGKQIDFDSLISTYIFHYSVVQGYTGDQEVITSDPKLGPLGDYGGYTQTIPLLEGSSAIDTGDGVYYSATDQRGVSRPQGNGYDIGAYEVYVYVDTFPPEVESFSIPASTNSLDFPILAFTATDDVGVTGYMITMTYIQPDANDPGWTSTAPMFAHVGAGGTYTLYPWAKDAEGNISPPYTSPPSILLDITAPWVTFIFCQDPNPTDSASVGFTVTFSEPVSGVDRSDFSLTKTGSITGESITSVGGGPDIYTVTVDTGEGSGTLRLDIPSTAEIYDFYMNHIDGLPFTAGQIYTITKPFLVFLPLVAR